MFVVTHASTIFGGTQEFKTLADAQEWILILLRNKTRFEVFFRA
jgi:hypothetical protein